MTCNPENDARKAGLRSRPKRTGQARRRNKGGEAATGNIRKSHERYMALARAAEAAGNTASDAADTENLYQHAEHYFRLMQERAV